MNSHIKTLSLLSGALLFSGVIYFQGCTKDKPLGDDDAKVATGQNSNSSPQPAPLPMAAPPPTATPEVIVAAKPSPSKEKRAVAAQQSQQTVMGDYVAARREIEVIEGAKKRQVDFQDQVWAYATGRPEPVTVPPPSEPSKLVAEASALLGDQRSLPTAFRGSTTVVASSKAVNAKQALTLADRALELMKAQPEPDDAQQNKEYLDTKRAALAVRAKALSTLASTYEPTRVDEAERAYNEYFAVESDPRKRSVAENELASLLYGSGRWEKAKVMYQRVLASNPKNPTALARLAGIMRAIAEEQESAGQITEAKTSSDAAEAYSDRLRDVENASQQSRRPPVTGVVNGRTRVVMPAAKPPVGERAGAKAGRKIP